VTPRDRTRRRRDLLHGPQWIAGTAITVGAVVVVTAPRLLGPPVLALTCTAAIPALLVLRKKLPGALREPSPAVAG
jgi:hypothetical protein